MKKNKFRFIAIIAILVVFSCVGFSSKYKEYNTNKNLREEEKKAIVGNYYLVDNNWLLGKFSKIVPKENMKVYSDTINELSRECKAQGKDVYYVSMANKTNMLKHLYPKFVSNKDNIDINKNLLKSQLDKDSISFIDIDEYFLSMFTESEREKFYFKTDHHWNGFGAYEGFKFTINNMKLGLEKTKLDNYFDQYKSKVVENKEFIGSYNKKLKYIVKEKEYTNYKYKKGNKLEYYNTDGKKDNKISEKSIMASLRDKDSWDYGGAYMRGTKCDILKIKNNNPLVNKKVLVFRDSYQAPMSWLLADAFSEVQFVDPRYIDNIDMTYDEIIKNSDCDTVLFMYNSFGFEEMIKKMIDKGIK